MSDVKQPNATVRQTGSANEIMVNKYTSMNIDKRRHTDNACLFYYPKTYNAFHMRSQV